jgi:hypothetical protein
MSSVTPPASNTLLLRRQLAELTKHPVEGFSAGAYPTVLLQSFQLARPDSHLREGLVDESNLYEWEIMIIGFVSPPSPLLLFCPLSSFPTPSPFSVLRTLTFDVRSQPCRYDLVCINSPTGFLYTDPYPQRGWFLQGATDLPARVS